jgi:uncharacterized protein
MTDRQDDRLPTQDFDNEDSNRSSNRHFADVLAVNLRRRGLLKGGSMAVGAAAAVAAMPLAARPLAESIDRSLGQQGFNADEIKSLAARPGHAAIAVTRDNTISVPQGYRAQVLIPWGEPLKANGPAYKGDGSNTGAEQEQQIGMHHDGIHYFPLRNYVGQPQRGLLVLNHEYIDERALHPNGIELVDGKRRADDVRKEIAAHGVSVVEVGQGPNGWQRFEGPYDRRITGATLMEISGPVRGHDKVKTKFSPTGTQTRGTLNNCGHGYTPWGTYLTCEENWSGYFVNKDAARPREHSRYGVPSSAGRYGWETVEERFNASSVGSSATADFRNEPNTFGYIVEIDPFDPTSVPKKRTALGRFGHEGAWFAPPRTGRPFVIYSGDDAQNEYIYKFVTRAVFVPTIRPADALDSGTLYVAKFNDDGSGEWLPLDFDNAAFKAAAAAAGVSFSSQADVLLNTRLAADVVGATKMDRPEWGTVDPVDGQVYFTLTNNSARTAAQANAANPRGPNPFGHILRWREEGDNHAALRFRWDLFLLSGTETDSAVLPAAGGNRKLTAASIHASPDGLWFDAGGLLWIQTDMSGSQLGTGPFGNNQMLSANVTSGEIRRFLVGPKGCEVTGVITTPDLRTMFVNIQHPGEDGTRGWPDGGDTRPRSACVVITREDGGLIGT